MSCSQSTIEEIKIQFTDKITKCKKQVDKAECQLEQINKKSDELAVYYCENQSTFKLEEFFKIFSNLCLSIRNMEKEKKRVKELEEKTLKRKQELESQRKDKQNPSKEVLNEESGLKDFLNALKSGNKQEILKKRQPARRFVEFNREFNLRN